jgi:CheY-like chemotaxis protein
VRVATCGVDAIEAASDNCPELVLLDIGLPGMDGYEVAKKLRREICPDARLIAISGYGDEETSRRTKEAGFDHQLVKPVDFDALISLLNQTHAAT